MRKKRFQLVYGKSAKFWEVSVSGSSMTTTYGRIGSKGQRTEKNFSSSDEAQKAADRLIRQKIDKGYTQVKAVASRKRSTSKPAATSRSKANAPGKPAKKAGDDRRPIDKVRCGAKAGNAADQAELGYRYAKGKGVKRSYKFAAKWFDAAAQQGNPRAQVNLGLLYLAGKGVEQDSTKGENWVKKAADQGFADAQYNLGFFASKGSIGPVTAQDLIDIFEAEPDEIIEKRRARNKRAADWYRLAADQGHVEAQVALGKCYLEGLGVPQDYEKAVRWFESASSDKENDADLANAYYLLGQSVENGKCVAEELLGYKLPYAQLIPPDPRGAIPVYKKASGSGNLDAAFRLGAIYKDGLGIRRNYKVAARWLQKAADGGIPEAQYEIGDLYWDGRGVKQSRKKALRWWRVAASKGIAKAMYRIAEAHASGAGIRRNAKEAERWYLKAAKEGYPDAQFVIAERHLASAKGGKRKIAQALKWYRKAAEAGHVDAQTKLTEHYADPDVEISKLHQMIDEFAATRKEDELATEWLKALRESICQSWSAICVPIEDFEEDRTSSMIGGWPVITNRYPSLPAEWAPMLQLDLTDITKVTGEVVGDGWLQPRQLPTVPGEL
jgi:TPR repeat protein